MFKTVGVDLKMELYYQYRIRPWIKRLKINKKYCIVNIRLKIPDIGYTFKFNYNMDIRFKESQEVLIEYYKNPYSSRVKKYIENIIEWQLNDADIITPIIMKMNTKPYNKWRLLIQSLRWNKDKMNIDKYLKKGNERNEQQNFGTNNQ